MKNIVEEDPEVEEESSNLTSGPTPQNATKSFQTRRTNNSINISRTGKIKDVFESFQLDRSLELKSKDERRQNKLYKS